MADNSGLLRHIARMDPGEYKSFLANPYSENPAHAPYDSSWIDRVGIMARDYNTVRLINSALMGTDVTANNIVESGYVAEEDELIKNNQWIAQYYPRAWEDLQRSTSSLSTRRRIDKIRSVHPSNMKLAEGSIYGNLLAALPAAFFDPINFIPIVGAPARALGMTATTASKLSTRMAINSLENTILTLAVEPLMQEHDLTRTETDAMIDLFGSALLGGLFPVAGHAFRKGARKAKETTQRAVLGGQTGDEFVRAEAGTIQKEMDILAAENPEAKAAFDEAAPLDPATQEIRGWMPEDPELAEKAKPYLREVFEKIKPGSSVILGAKPGGFVSRFIVRFVRMNPSQRLLFNMDNQTQLTARTLIRSNLIGDDIGDGKLSFEEVVEYVAQQIEEAQEDIRGVAKEYQIAVKDAGPGRKFSDDELYELAGKLVNTGKEKVLDTVGYLVPKHFKDQPDEGVDPLADIRNNEAAVRVVEKLAAKERSFNQTVWKSAQISGFETKQLAEVDINLFGGQASYLPRFMNDEAIRITDAGFKHIKDNLFVKAIREGITEKRDANITAFRIISDTESDRVRSLDKEIEEKKVIDEEDPRLGDLNRQRATAVETRNSAKDILKDFIAEDWEKKSWDVAKTIAENYRRGPFNNGTKSSSTVSQLMKRKVIIDERFLIPWKENNIIRLNQQTGHNLVRRLIMAQFVQNLEDNFRYSKKLANMLDGLEDLKNHMEHLTNPKVQTTNENLKWAEYADEIAGLSELLPISNQARLLSGNDLELIKTPEYMDALGQEIFESVSQIRGTLDHLYKQRSEVGGNLQRVSKALTKLTSQTERIQSNIMRPFYEAIRIREEIKNIGIDPKETISDNSYEWLLRSHGYVPTDKDGTPITLIKTEPEKFIVAPSVSERLKRNQKITIVPKEVEPERTGPAVDSTLFTGGASGADNWFGKTAEEYGAKVKHFIIKGAPKPETKHIKGTPREGKPLDFTEVPVHPDANKAIERAAQRIGEKVPKPKSSLLPLVQKSYSQVVDADAVFAVGYIKRTFSIEAGEKLPRPLQDVEGGVGQQNLPWAVGMAQDLGKPVYVFDMETNKWYQWKVHKAKLERDKINDKIKKLSQEISEIEKKTLPLYPDKKQQDALKRKNRQRDALKAKLELKELQITPGHYGVFAQMKQAPKLTKKFAGIGAIARHVKPKKGRVVDRATQVPSKKRISKGRKGITEDGIKAIQGLFRKTFGVFEHKKPVKKPVQKTVDIKKLIDPEIVYGTETERRLIDPLTSIKIKEVEEPEWEIRASKSGRTTLYVKVGEVEKDVKVHGIWKKEKSGGVWKQAKIKKTNVAKYIGKTERKDIDLKAAKTEGTYVLFDDKFFWIHPATISKRKKEALIKDLSPQQKYTGEKELSVPVKEFVRKARKEIEEVEKNKYSLRDLVKEIRGVRKIELERELSKLESLITKRSAGDKKSKDLYDKITKALDRYHDLFENYIAYTKDLNQLTESIANKTYGRKNLEALGVEPKKYKNPEDMEPDDKNSDFIGFSNQLRSVDIHRWRPHSLKKKLEGGSWEEKRLGQRGMGEYQYLVVSAARARRDSAYFFTTPATNIMRSQRTHYFDKDNKGLTEKNWASAADDMTYIHNQLLGRSAISSENIELDKVLRILKNTNYMRYMGMVTISSLSDFGNAVGTLGMGRYIRTLFHYIGSPDRKNISHLARMNAAYELAQVGTTTSKRHGLDQEFDYVSPASRVEESMAKDFGVSGRTSLDKVDEFFSQGGTAMRMYNALNLLNRWNSFNKEIVTLGLEDMIVELGVKIHKGGKISERDHALARAIGFNKEELGRVGKYWSDGKATTRKTAIGRDFYVAHSEHWDDELFAFNYQAKIKGAVNNIIVTPSVGSLPKAFRESRAINLMMQFKSFHFASFDMTFAPWLQRGVILKDPNQVMQFVTTAVFGGFTAAIYEFLRGKNPFVDGVKKDEDGNVTGRIPWAQRLYTAGIDRSGMFALMFEVQNIIERQTGYGFHSLFSGELDTKYRARSLWDLVGGPSFGLGKDMLTAMSWLGDPSTMPSQGELSSIRRMIPYQNLILAKIMFDVGPSILEAASTGQPLLPEFQQGKSWMNPSGTKSNHVFRKLEERLAGE